MFYLAANYVGKLDEKRDDLCKLVITNDLFDSRQFLAE